MTTPNPIETPDIPVVEKKGGMPLWAQVLVWVGLVALLLLVGLGLKRAQRGTIAVGDSVPNFVLTTFDGQEIEFDAYKGKLVVINFWASWCKPCEQEAADLQRAWEYYEPTGKVIFLGVDYVDTEPEAVGYLNKFSITYPNAPDLGTRVSQLFRIQGVPETYFVGADGTLKYVQIGPFMSLDDIKSVVDRFMP